MDLTGARKVFEPLKSELARFLGAPIRFTVHGDGAVKAEAPARLTDFLREVPTLRLRRAVQDSHERGFRPLRDVLPDGADDPRGPEDLLDLPELHFAGRADALRVLFAHRDRSRDVWLWAREALLIPIALGAGPPVWAWEVLRPGHATYLFRPGSEHAFLALLDVLRDEGTRRREIRGTALGAKLGYLDRVEHDDEQTGLERWRAALQAALALIAES